VEMTDALRLPAIRTAAADYSIDGVLEPDENEFELSTSIHPDYYWMIERSMPTRVYLAQGAAPDVVAGFGRPDAIRRLFRGFRQCVQQ
jgi:hypothetical protein